MATDDYYEGQGRLDGALQRWYTEEDKMAFLRRAHEKNIVNIEMESTSFLMFANRLGVPATIVAVAVLDRLNGDQHAEPGSVIFEISERPGQVAINFCKMMQDRSPGFGGA